MSRRQLRFLRTIDDQHAVVSFRASGLHEQRNDVNLVVAAGRCGSARQLCANGGMRDRLQLASLRRIAEHALAHARAIELAMRIENFRAELGDQLAERRLPGATTSRAIWSVSSTGTPSFANSSRDRGLAAGDAAGERDQQGRVILRIRSSHG